MNQLDKEIEELNDKISVLQKKHNRLVSKRRDMEQKTLQEIGNRYMNKYITDNKNYALYIKKVTMDLSHVELIGSGVALDGTVCEFYTVYRTIKLFSDSEIPFKVIDHNTYVETCQKLLLNHLDNFIKAK